MPIKRKDWHEPGEQNSETPSTNVKEIRATPTPSAPYVASKSTLTTGNEAMPLSILSACRTAMVKSPAMSRSALSKHRGSIDSTTARTLETVGSYTLKDGRTPLHESVRQGDLATTQTLISAGADVNADDDDCASPIDLARDDSPCHFLLQHHSAAFATVNDDPNSLILSAIAHCAALSGYKDIVRAPALSLHQYQLDPSFHWAPREARFLVFKWARNAFVAQLATTIQPLNDLPDDCAGDVLGCLEMAMTYEEPLCIARHYMSPEAQFWVRAVVTAAIAANATAALRPAVENDDVAGVRNCLAKGANIDAQHEDTFTPLMIACIYDHVDVVDVLLEAGASTEATNRDGETALMRASQYGRIDCVELLLKAGANADTKDDNGDTALVFASSRGCSVTVSLLRQADAKMDHPEEEDGLTALMKASQNSEVATVKHLLEAGANKDATDEAGRTALMYASYKGCTIIMKLLLEAGVDKEIEDDDGETALIIATLSGHASNMKVLLEAGANTEVQDKHGRTPLMNASRFGHIEMINLLLQAGAKKEAEDIFGATALSWAKRSGRAEVMALLQ